VEILADLEAKKEALEWIMRQYGKGTWTFPEEILKKTFVLRVRINEISGKARKSRV
jgi:nitroimidazol reductase NimA-like FMN-containing flavoprotein (pyridoxamine 5'-phosphate oxidase superfamily)